jgi:hypothetical protein
MTAQMSNEKSGARHLLSTVWLGTMAQKGESPNAWTRRGFQVNQLSMRKDRREGYIIDPFCGSGWFAIV